MVEYKYITIQRQLVGADEYDYMLWRRDEKLLIDERKRLKMEAKRLKKEAKQKSK